MRVLTMATVAFCAFSLPALAEEKLNSDTFVGVDTEQVELSLRELGYQVLEVHANGKASIEAKVLKDGKSGEIYVDPASGKPTKIEME